MVGAIDDWRKIRSGKKGLSVRSKLAAQCLVVMPVAGWLCRDGDGALGAVAFVWVTLVVIGSSNAVNLTDGLDGLAAGCLLPVFIVLCWLGIAREAETALLPAALAGALLGFLQFNRHPARVFLGDCGALPLGGLLGYTAVRLEMGEWLLLLAGVLVAETFSVILQVGRFKIQGKRFFLCAPLHHHFQFLGWPEPTIVRCFSVASLLCALAGAVGIGLFVSLDRDDHPAPAWSISHNGASSSSESTSAVGSDSASVSRVKYPEATASDRQPFCRAQSISRGVSPMMITSEESNNVPPR
jgi:phospho-N-acetylmuramoyl-pentapeptide-transferase